MSLVSHAERELDAIGLTANTTDEMNLEMRKCVLDIIKLFAEQGHSGYSASCLTGLVTKLMKYEILSPLTGESEEWVDVGENLWQNNRCGTVFRDDFGKAWNIDGIIFYDEVVDDNGEVYKSYFTNYHSRVEITFPYTPKSIHRKRPPDQE